MVDFLLVQSPEEEHKDFERRREATPLIVSLGWFLQKVADINSPTRIAPVYLTQATNIANDSTLRKELLTLLRE